MSNLDAQYSNETGEIRRENKTIMTEDKTWTKSSNGFIKKPGKGWLHTDDSIQDGITYNVKVK